MAKIVIAKDISAYIEENQDSLKMETLINTLLLLAGFFLVYYVFNMYENNMSEEEIQRYIEGNKF